MNDHHVQATKETPTAQPHCCAEIHSASEGALRTKDPNLVVAVAFTLPLVLIAMTETTVVSSSITAWIELVLASVVVFYSGRSYLASGYQGFASLKPNMFSLIAMGVSAAYLFSAYTVVIEAIAGKSISIHSLYFESAAAITCLTMIGQILESKAHAATQSAVALLTSSFPRTVFKVTESGEDIEAVIDSVQPGDKLRVRAFDKVPADGVIVVGSSSIDQSMLSGESNPVPKIVGDSITAGTINCEGSFVMEVMKTGNDTVLARMIKAVKEAQQSKLKVETLVDKISLVFVPLVILASLASLYIWLSIDGEAGLSHAINNAISVLIIACPCALGLATPLSIVVTTGIAARNGMILRDASSIERLAHVDTLVTDKTGTLTEGKPFVQHVLTTNGFTEAEVIMFAQSVETASTHPFSKAILACAKKMNIKNRSEASPDRPTTFNTKVLAGQGIIGAVNNRQVLVGAAALLSQFSVDVSDLVKAGKQFADLGKSAAYVAIGGKAAGLIIFGDPLRPSASEALEELRSMKVDIVVASGDQPGPVETVCRELEITKFYSQQSPEDKGLLVENLQAQSKVVAFAGDGINDGIAISKADAGIAMGSGSDLAIESASIVILMGDLKSIARSIRLSKAMLGNINGNLTLAFAYNLLAVPLAAGLFEPAFHLSLNPMLASACMTLSSLSVALNALSLNGKKL